MYELCFYFPYKIQYKCFIISNSKSFNLSIPYLLSVLFHFDSSNKFFKLIKQLHFTSFFIPFFFDQSFTLLNHQAASFTHIFNQSTKKSGLSAGTNLLSSIF